MVAVAIQFRIPSGVAESYLGAWSWIIISESALFPEQPGMFLTQPDQGWHHLLPAQQPDPGVDADGDRLAIVMDGPVWIVFVQG